MVLLYYHVLGMKGVTSYCYYYYWYCTVESPSPYARLLLLLYCITPMMVTVAAVLCWHLLAWPEYYHRSHMGGNGA